MAKTANHVLRSFFMPELPEVETIANYLKSVLVNKKILKIEFLSGKIKKIIGDFSILVDADIVTVYRRAKYIFLLTSSMSSIVFHLGMTGRILYKHFNSSQYDKHDHLLIAFYDGTLIIFNDIRRFGSVRLVNDIEGELSFLGVEPLSSEFTFLAFKGMFMGKKRLIKSFLLDQKFLVGIGNIYASEILFLSKISPLRSMHSLNNQELQSLYFAIKFILNEAIVSGGTTIKDYLSPDGQFGGFRSKLKVYDRANKPCVLCFVPIERVMQNSRSTFFCPSCQI